jgi:aryl-alcohol dehydrogenase-like predicted oxidoreductase
MGKTGIELSELGYGAWGLGGLQWRGGSDEESARALRTGFELGINFIDTALAYGDGHSEKVVGEAVQQSQLALLIATKIPPADRIWPAQADSRFSAVFPKDYVIACTNQSLRNLGVERIDIQQFHVWNAHWTGQDEWKRVVEDLKNSGKVRYFGVSLTEHDPDSGIKLAASGLVDLLQVIYNIFDPAAADRLFPAAAKQGVAVLARVPFDEGSLAGTIHDRTEFEEGDFRAFYFRGERKKQVAARVQELQRDVPEFASRLPELALRFCLSDARVTSVIPGMRRASHVASNIRAAMAGALPQQVLAILDKHRWNRNFYQ